MNHRKRALAMLLCALAALIMTVSAAYIVHETAHDHDCIGVDCPVCSLICQLVSAQRHFGVALLMLASVLIILDAGRRVRAFSWAELPASATLVSSKIRLND